MKKILLLLLILPVIGLSQNILKDANTIVVKGITFIDVCNKLLDDGYSIDKKDNDLKTVKTEKKEYPKYWNATYIVNIRVKDSSAYISGTYTAPPNGGLFKDEPVTNLCNKRGETYQKSMEGYIFLLLNEFALSFKKEVSYLKR